MSRKTKRHQNQHDNRGDEMNVRKGTDLLKSNLGEQAQSALESVRETAGTKKLLLSLIGVGAGIAATAVLKLVHLDLF